MCYVAGSRLCSSLTRPARSFAATGRARSSIRTAFRLTVGTASGLPIATHIRLSSSTSRARYCCGSATATFRDGWPFNHPTRATVSPDGEIYVADGYGNARIHRFTPEGEWRASFGDVGQGPGEFMTPHSIIVDRQGRLVVCDRENDRVQLFDRDGRWIAEWRGLCGPMDLCECDDGAILVTDQVPSVNAFAPNGARIGRGRPSLNGAHGIALGRAGEIYLAEIDPSVVTKLTPC
jgi:6-bladed beta-propeller protein